MSSGSKIVKSGNEPPTAVELDIAQVTSRRCSLRTRLIDRHRRFSSSNWWNWKAMLSSKDNCVNFTSPERRFVIIRLVLLSLDASIVTFLESRLGWRTISSGYLCSRAEDEELTTSSFITCFWTRKEIQPNRCCSRTSNSSFFANEPRRKRSASF